jgi:DNA modification methylase
MDPALAALDFAKASALFVGPDTVINVCVPAKFPARRTSACAKSREVTRAIQTNERIVERCVLMATDPGDLVLDPT